MFDQKKLDAFVEKQPAAGLKSIGKRDFNTAVAAVQAVLNVEKQIEGANLTMQSAIGALPAKIQGEAKASEEVAVANSKDYKKALANRKELEEKLPELILEAKMALSVLSPSARAKVEKAERFI